MALQPNLGPGRFQDIFLFRFPTLNSWWGCQFQVEADFSFTCTWISVSWSVSRRIVARTVEMCRAITSAYTFLFTWYVILLYRITWSVHNMLLFIQYNIQAFYCNNMNSNWIFHKCNVFFMFKQLNKLFFTNFSMRKTQSPVPLTWRVVLCPNPDVPQISNLIYWAAGSLY
jgi:hypothetical protein